MSSKDFYQVFLEQLESIFSAKKQIVEYFPNLINKVQLEDLKENLSSNLEETKNQIERLNRIFSILEVESRSKNCLAMEGLIKEVEEMTRNKIASPILDATLIAAVQKIEHYQIACYGTLRSFAKHLGLDDEIPDLIQESLDEEGEADKKLSKLADGSLFSSGINKEAASEEIRLKN